MLKGTLLFVKQHLSRLPSPSRRFPLGFCSPYVSLRLVSPPSSPNCSFCFPPATITPDKAFISIVSDGNGAVVNNKGEKKKGRQSKWRRQKRSISPSPDFKKPAIGRCEDKLSACVNMYVSLKGGGVSLWGCRECT